MHQEMITTVSLASTHHFLEITFKKKKKGKTRLGMGEMMQ